MDHLKYLKKENNTKKLLRAEIFFAPLLIIIPMIVGFLLIRDFYIRGYIQGNKEIFSHLIFGIIIIIGNILFDIPFIKSLKDLSKKRK